MNDIECTTRLIKPLIKLIDECLANIHALNEQITDLNHKLNDAHKRIDDLEDR